MKTVPDTVYTVYPGLYLMRDLKSLSASHQVSSFFEVSARITLFSIMIKNIPDARILDSAAGSRGRQHIRLLPI